MTKLRVGVLRGGPSSEYDISLKTGGEVLKFLDRKKYEPIDILIDKNGEWHLFGMAVPIEKCIRQVDVMFNALHGEYGEDGKVQQILEQYKIPYTGSGSVASAAAMQKRLSREIFMVTGIKTPETAFARRGDNIPRIASAAIRRFGLPLVVKPASRGSSVGVTIASTIYTLIEGFENAFAYDKEVLVEQYIKGQEVTCAVLENFRNVKHYVFPVVEIIPPSRKVFFDRECKYDGSTREICPARFDLAMRDKVQQAAVAAHQSLGCRQYSRSDFIISPDHQVYILELNTLPGLTNESLVPKAAESIGLNFPQFLDHLISLSIKNPIG